MFAKIGLQNSQENTSNVECGQLVKDASQAKDANKFSAHGTYTSHSNSRGTLSHWDNNK
jgi:hypothetical protein